MTERLLAVIDQGSTATKGAVMSTRGKRLFETSLPVECRRDGLRVEHDPEQIVAGVRKILEELLDGREVAAIGLTCQRSTCLLWEREGGRPLTTALSWQDRSRLPAIERLEEHRDEVAKRTGLQLNPHYAAAKLAYLIDRLPAGRQLAEAGEIVAGTLDAFLVRSLIGVDATEPGHAGRSLVYNLEDGQWDPWLCDLFGVPAAALPELRTSTGNWGEFNGVPLTAVAGDQQAALIGHGGWRRGATAAHFGTGAFVLAATGVSPQRHPGLLTAVLAATPRQRRFQIEGTVNSAGSAVDWACRLTGTKIEEYKDRPLNLRKLPMVVPAFAGLGAPWWRPRARGVIGGLTPDTTGDELIAGVLAGVGMRVVDCVDALSEAGVKTRTLRVSGKLTRLRGFVDLLAGAAQVPVEVSIAEETGLAGITRLATAGLDDEESGLMASPPASRKVEPSWSARDARRARGLWRSFLDTSLPPGNH